MTYRYPVPSDLERRGIIFYIHGFGSYCERFAFQAKAYAEAGYDVVALDQRGFGNSGGTRGLFEDSYNDIYLMILKTINIYKIDQQKLPFFLYGNSFGALLAFNLSIKFPTMFAGLILSAPFFKHYTNILDKYKYAFKVCNFLKLGFSINNRDKTKPQYKKIATQYPFYVEDDKQVTLAKVSSLCLFLDEQDFAFTNYAKCKTPILVMIAKDDTAVKNSSAVDIL